GICEIRPNSFTPRQVLPAYPARAPEWTRLSDFGGCLEAPAPRRWGFLCLCDRRRALAALRQSRSVPERLCRGEGLITLDRCGQRGFDLRVLVAGQQSGCKSPLAARALRTYAGTRHDRGVDGDVVEVAEAVLQVLERGDEGLVPPACVLAIVERGEELGGIAQLLGADAQLVALARGELGELPTALFHLAIAPLQLRTRECLDRHIAKRARPVVVRIEPIAGLQPRGDVQRERTEAHRVDRMLRPLLRRLAPRHEVRGEGADAGVMRMMAASA